ncbi:T6SS effector BTH_I2691 family protein [Burkholderia sp. BCC1640]|uniref:T6SS effector BTH_I2691 family protein n=1 Tax=Burkholderia sp. BCC1640 TaxID=2676294 RepID=UPI00158A85A0|nr:T6SS effector BTH_I2691 family protein [Burkholderia sp. BCC1640]
MDSANQCANCEKTGLPILPVRYTVVPNTVAAKLPAGIGGHGVTDVKLTEHRYAVRTLRAGWLYLFYVKGARGSNYWEAYNVTGDGRLWKQSLPLPVEPTTHPACAKKAIAVPMDIIAIERPEKCTDRVYIAFSQHAWHRDTFELYKKDAALRQRRMQWIEPSKWISASQDAQGHAVVATRQSIDDVIEYMPGLDPKLLQPPEQTLSDETGKYKPAVMRQETTCYPLHIRQASPASASDALIRVMNDVGQIGKGKHHSPMLLALWDGIGNVHELNGFRNDAGSWLMTYTRERVIQVDALESITAAEGMVRNGAVESKSRSRSAWTAGWEAIKNNPYAADGVPDALVVSPEQQAMSDKKIAAAGVITPAEAKQIGDAAWPKYYRKLDPQKLDVFRPWYESVQKASHQLQANRTSDVGAWLKASTFLVTLHDYHENDFQDGVAFAAVIDAALWGLPSEDKGAKLIEDLVNNMDPTQPSSLVWRAFAYNQQDQKEEIKALLAKATEYKAQPASVGDQVSHWADFVSSYLLKNAKSFLKFCDKMTDVLKRGATAASGSELVVKGIHGDQLAVTMGNGLFKWSKSAALVDCVGMYLIRGTLMIRGGIAHADTVKLIKAAMAAEPAMRLGLQMGYRALRQQGVPPPQAYLRSLQAVGSDKQVKNLTDMWEQVSRTEKGASTQLNARLASTLVVIEMLNFGCLLAKADKSGDDYALLVASGVSVVGAIFTVSEKALKAFSSEAAQTLRNLKAITSFLGGVSALIQGVVDFHKGFDKAKSNNYRIAVLYFVKSALGIGTGVSYLLTALTSSAPLLARLAGGGSRIVILARGGAAGIAGATARLGSFSTPEVAEAGGWRARQAAAKVAGRAAVGVAAEEVGITIGSRGALLLLGRSVLILTGWEVALAVVAIQFLIWYFSDDDLQTWLEKCVFGRKTASPSWDAGKQSDEYEKALKAMGLSTDGTN